MKLETVGPFTLSTEGAFPLSTDAMLLGAFAAPKRGDKVCDLGCGSGVLGLLLLAKEPELAVTGIDLDEDALRCAAENIRRNALEDRFSLLPADLREPDTLPNGTFRYAVANPPYFPEGSGGIREAQPRAVSETSCSPEKLFAAADRLLQWGGRLALVHRPERLADLCAVGRSHRLEAKRLRLVRHHAGAAPSLLLCEFHKGGHPGLRWENDLLLCLPDGSPSPELQIIYHQEG